MNQLSISPKALHPFIFLFFTLSSSSVVNGLRWIAPPCHVHVRSWNERKCTTAEPATTFHNMIRIQHDPLTSPSCGYNKNNLFQTTRTRGTYISRTRTSNNNRPIRKTSWSQFASIPSSVAITRTDNETLREASICEVTTPNEDTTAEKNIVATNSSTVPNKESESAKYTFKRVNMTDVSREKDSITPPRENERNVSCIVASRDGKLPERNSPVLHASLGDSEIIDRLDMIYHALAHAESSHFRYFDWENNSKNNKNNNDSNIDSEENAFDIVNGGDENNDKNHEEEELVSILKSSLSDAGFQLLKKRDLDLCEALNAGYLLRLSIEPDVKKLDPTVSAMFYPDEHNTEPGDDNNDDDNDSSFLMTLEEDDNEGKEREPPIYGGRILVFRRGYSQEISCGRLLLPKFDYLQASLVQRSAAFVINGVSDLERKFTGQVEKGWKKIKKEVSLFVIDCVECTPNQKVKEFLSSKLGLQRDVCDAGTEKEKDDYESEFKKRNVLGRYAGTVDDAIAPFLVREVQNSGQNSMAQEEERTISCDYDLQHESKPKVATQLLERTSISNVVDFFSSGGKRRLLRSLFMKSELVEPTFEEVVVIWRPLPPKTKPSLKATKSLFVIPKPIYNMAEIFGVDDRLPPKSQPPLKPKSPPLEIRVFQGVQMANLPAVLPEPRLVFRPADAFVFDTISIFSLLAVLGSQRYDNPKLDLIAIVSVSLWLLRTFFRYSNKIARYDLLVNKFLTSKLAQRGAGALKYITTEGGYQRATRAGLLYMWIMGKIKEENEKTWGVGDVNGESKSTFATNVFLTRDYIISEGIGGVSDLLGGNADVNIDIEAALDDLKDLDLVEHTVDGDSISGIKVGAAAITALGNKWISLFIQD